MKKLHLICNAHLDPIWQWTWDEGISAALSTFATAADLADEFDYIFCHNEAALYEQIELHAPELFERIKKLVEKGKWHIMGGWYIQPDCNMPCGESILRQIKTGMKYFSDKFGVKPTTAINFDPFGHNIGLVQIMAACGQDSYIVCRPNPGQFDYPSNMFTWEAPDGSKVMVARANSYNSPLGKSVGKIRDVMSENASEDVHFVLWGVGNHGGGPSRKDLADIEKLIAQTKDTEIVHSTPEKYFAEATPHGTVTRSLNLCMPGCYTSMEKVKKAHRATENLLYGTEQMHAVAALNGMKGGEIQLKDAEKKLLLAQFHDILPGSCVESGEQNGLRLLYAAREELENLRTRAFFDLIKGEKKAKDGEYPIFAFNYMPYEIETEIEAEFNLADQGWGDVTEVEVYGSDGKRIDSQLIKESSTIALDWRKRVIFRAKLKPLALTRFSLQTGKAAEKAKPEKIQSEKDAIKKYSGGLLSDPVALKMYDDTADPWGMSAAELKGMGTNGRVFSAMTDKEAKEFCGAEKVKPFERIECGPVMRAYESFSKCGNTRARTEYRFYDGLPYVDINVDVEFADKNKLVRLFVPCPSGEFFGDGPFVTESKFDDGREVVFQKLVGVKNGDECFAVINDCVYGGKKSDGGIEITLLRGAGYCFHPIYDRELYPQDRYLPRIDSGKYSFSFRLYKGGISDALRLAELFNRRPYVINAFPLGGDRTAESLKISGDDVVVTTIKKRENGNGTLVRVFNPLAKAASFAATAGGVTREFTVAPYKFAAVAFDGKDIVSVSPSEV